LILAYFDLVNIQYDDGLKVRLGVDPEKQKQEELARRRAELLSSRKLLSERVIDRRWSARVESHKKSVECNGRVISDLRYKIFLKYYDYTKNVGQASLGVNGTISLDSRPSSDECRKQFRFSQRENIVNVQNGVSIMDMDFDGSFGFDDSVKLANVHLVEVRCTRECLELDIILELLPSGTLIYRGPGLASNMNVVSLWHWNDPGRRIVVTAPDASFQAVQ
jgi:hypothetical protein